MAAHRGLCARFHKAVELIGGRWTGAVIQILLHGSARYAEIRDAIPDISDRMLSERLRELETEDIVVRRVIPETPVRVEYELTEKGRALEPSITAIGTWAQKWVSGSPPASRPPSNASRRRLPSARSRRARPVLRS
jgi:DNA-binding HxlR family transcriptional regulator